MGPSFIAGAFFVGIILNDLIQKTATMEIVKHTLFGFVAIASLWVLEISQRAAVAWGLFLIPTVVFLSSFIYVLVNGSSKQIEAPLPFSPAPKPPAPEPEPVVNLPEENTVCVELTFDPTKPPPRNPYESTCEVSESTGDIGLPGTFTSKPADVKTTDKDTSKGTFTSKPADVKTTDKDTSKGTGKGAETGTKNSLPEAAPTAQEILGELNRRLTPYTVCEK